jgi:hypothetical protein
MLALAFLTGICVQPLSQATPALVAEPSSAVSPTSRLLPLTVPEVRHVLGCLIWPPPSSARLVLAWSWWRCCHRSRACYYHTKRRLEAG